MFDSPEKNDDGFDAGKRETLKRIVTGASFVIPVVVSFPISGLTINSALAACQADAHAPGGFVCS